MQQRFHFRYANELVGAFVLLALLLLVAGIFFTARSQGWFAPRYRFELLLPEITGKLGGEARDLPGTVLQAQKTMYEMELLVEALQRHWLVRKYVEPPTTAPRIAPGRLEGGRP